MEGHNQPREREFSYSFAPESGHFAIVREEFEHATFLIHTIVYSNNTRWYLFETVSLTPRGSVNLLTLPEPDEDRGIDDEIY